MTMRYPTRRARLSLPLLIGIIAISLSQVSAFSVLVKPSPRSVPLVSSTKKSYPSSSSRHPSLLVLASQSQEEGGESISSPLSDPALATLDVVALLGFAAIGKASHAPDGSIDFAAVLVTAFPFLAAWIATSPLTGVYQDLEAPFDGKASVAKAAAVQTAKGWALAVPLGCALRGIIKGYVPPLPFVIVTLVATLVILGTVRVGYALATTPTLDE